MSRIKQGFEVSGSESVLELNGFPVLKEIGNRLEMEENPTLVAIRAFPALGLVNVLDIEYNILLDSYCGLQYLCQVNGIQDNYFIRGNLWNPTPQEILEEPCE